MLMLCLLIVIVALLVKLTFVVALLFVMCIRVTVVIGGEYNCFTLSAKYLVGVFVC